MTLLGHYRLFIPGMTEYYWLADLGDVRTSDLKKDAVEPENVTKSKAKSDKKKNFPNQLPDLDSNQDTLLQREESYH